MRGDCFYFMTAICSKGNECPYRHNTTAKYSTIVCPKWKSGTECTISCPYRHSEYSSSKEKDRTTTECYWEKNGGCKKNDCPFLHTQKPSSTSCLLDIQRLNYEMESLNIKDYDENKPIIAKNIQELMAELKEIDAIFHL